MRLFALLCLCSAVVAQDALDRALSELRTAARADRDAAVRKVLDLKPEPGELARRLRAGPKVTAIGAGWHVLAATDDQGVQRPFQLYVPVSLAGTSEPVPLLVHLHGGVSRPDFTRTVGQVGYGRRWVEPADENGFAACFPLGRTDCTWWSDAGVAHIRACIRETKRLVPVDDDGIVATGFSDGASGCYHLAMHAPWPFAGFLPMNGHPAVAASASGKQLYLRNLALRPLFAVSTHDDPLYPAVAVMEHLDLAARAGVRLRTVNWENGSHTPAYWEDLLPAFVGFITNTTRDPFPRGIDWRTAEPGAVAWVEILELGAAAGEMEADEDLNLMSTPGRVRLGFNVDRAYPGPGVKVVSVVGDTTAERIGLKKDDVVVRLDHTEVTTLQDLVGALGRKEFGTPVEVAVQRGGGDAVLKGEIPPFQPRPYYRRDRPTARIVVRVEDDRIVVRTRGVRSLRLYRWPGCPADVIVNGRDARRDLGAPWNAAARGTIPGRYAREADGGRLFGASMLIHLPGD